jgi:DNA-3-methyladenine glycosylase II
MKIKITKEIFKQAVETLSKRDPDLNMFYRTSGLPLLRTRSPGYGTLLKVICAQQVSTAAARAITGRLDSISKPMTPESFIGLSDKKVRKIGLSHQKENYGRGIAEAIINGTFSLRKIANMGDEQAIAEMMKLKGIGRWTAEVYLIFALRRPDLWPIDDLGIVKGVMGMKGLTSRPSRQELIQIGELYKPWRSAAARMMWHYTNVFRGN